MNDAEPYGISPQALVDTLPALAMEVAWEGELLPSTDTLQITATWTDARYPDPEVCAGDRLFVVGTASAVSDPGGLVAEGNISVSFARDGGWALHTEEDPGLVVSEPASVLDAAESEGLVEWVGMGFGDGTRVTLDRYIDDDSVVRTESWVFGTYAFASE